MLYNFFSLALQGTLRKKRSSILVFLVLMFSFSCAIVTISLTKTISDTNAEFRLNTYGEWYVAAVRAAPEDGEWLTSQSWAGKTAHNRVYNNIEGNVGIIDPVYFELARSPMVDGRLPEKKG